jgi:hypothetical protein
MARSTSSNRKKTTNFATPPRETMKRLVTGMMLGASLCAAGFAFAGAGKHPNLQAARRATNNAVSALDRAQNANEFDLDGKAANAKKELQQAMADIDAALAVSKGNAAKAE